MVARLSINKLQARDGLVIDSDVHMSGANDFDFAPRLSLNGNILSITSASDGSELATTELDEDFLLLVERDRSAELKVKFIVEGMHGHLDKIHPIIADGKAKKLAESRWKATLPINFE
tara:strand:- start:1098 stop:1451 length:354 start_codon:yes stop_codon:yes gene_type:complete